MLCGVVGLGLIGGSIALACINKNIKAYGYDTNSETVKQAKSKGIDSESIPDKIFQSGIIFISLYPNDTVEFIKSNCHKFKQDSIIIDCCGVKECILNEITPLSQQYGFTFIGGHSMFGSELSGFSSANTSLINDSTFLYVKDGAKQLSIDIFIHFVKYIGFKDALETTAKAHDLIISYTSQLPHIIACAYMLGKTITNQDIEKFCAGSHRDISRVANINANLWSELFIKNKENICNNIDIFISNLQMFKDLIQLSQVYDLKFLLEKCSMK